jgi:hypothetical protein
MEHHELLLAENKSAIRVSAALHRRSEVVNIAPENRTPTQITLGKQIPRCKGDRTGKRESSSNNFAACSLTEKQNRDSFAHEALSLMGTPRCIGYGSTRANRISLQGVRACLLCDVARVTEELVCCSSPPHPTPPTTPRGAAWGCSNRTRPCGACTFRAWGTPAVTTSKS